jgi:hypothetical protein
MCDPSEEQGQCQHHTPPNLGDFSTLIEIPVLCRQLPVSISGRQADAD